MWVAVVGTAGVLAGAMAGGWKHTGLNIEGAVAVTALIVVSFVWLAIRWQRVGAVRNFLRTRTIDVDGIRQISLEVKKGGENTEYWVPRIYLADGAGIWMEGLSCGFARRMPEPEQLAILDRFRAIVGLQSRDSSNNQGSTHG